VVRGGHCPNVTVSKKINAPYRSGPSKSWIKIKNPNAAAAMRIIDGTF
jgi:ATP-dependent DNA ligase